MVSKIGRNEPCPCGSGLKFKHCCNKPATLRLAASQMVICLLRQLGGKADVELEEIAALNKDVRINIEQEGNTMHLSVVEKAQEQSVIEIPEKRIITI